MFQIRYHIVDNLSELSDLNEDEIKYYGGIGGYIEISSEKESFGFYHDGPLWEDDCGSENIDYWMEELLEVVLHFKFGAAYAAFTLIETYDECLEFRKRENRISIKSAHRGNKFENCLFISEKSISSLSDNAEDYSIDMDEFQYVVWMTAQRFWKEVVSIEPQGRKLPSIQRIAHMLNKAADNSSSITDITNTDHRDS